MLDEHGHGLESKAQSACFRVCEALKRKLTEAFLQQLQHLYTFSLIIWLHDGIWVAPPPAPTTIGYQQPCMPVIQYRYHASAL